MSIHTKLLDIVVALLEKDALILSQKSFLLGFFLVKDYMLPIRMTDPYASSEGPSGSVETDRAKTPDVWLWVHLAVLS